MLVRLRPMLWYQDPATGGGSVTMPHKKDILPFLAGCSRAALEIGAVNTVYKVQGKLFGDNTDWWVIIGGWFQFGVNRTRGRGPRQPVRHRGCLACLCSPSVLVVVSVPIYSCIA